MSVKHSQSSEMGYYSEHTSECSSCKKEKPIQHFLVERKFKGIEYFRYIVNCFKCRYELEKKEWENEKAKRFSK